jgi:hypothetical protein
LDLALAATLQHFKSSFSIMLNNSALTNLGSNLASVPMFSMKVHWVFVKVTPVPKSVERSNWKRFFQIKYETESESEFTNYLKRCNFGFLIFVASSSASGQMIIFQYLLVFHFKIRIFNFQSLDSGLNKKNIRTFKFSKFYVG